MVRWWIFYHPTGSSRSTQSGSGNRDDTAAKRLRQTETKRSRRERKSCIRISMFSLQFLTPPFVIIDAVSKIIQKPYTSFPPRHCCSCFLTAPTVLSHINHALPNLLGRYLTDDSALLLDAFESETWIHQLKTEPSLA